jgi:hypothetical protein
VLYNTIQEHTMARHTPDDIRGDCYEGNGASGEVTFAGNPLNPCFDLCNHSPTGFSWGYGGSGPAQLALALAMHRLQDWPRVQRCYQFLKMETIARLPFSQDWSLTASQLDEGIRQAEALLLAKVNGEQ